MRRLAAACLLAAGAAMAVEVPQSAAQWQNSAAADIEAAYQLLLDNHPGTYDPANPDFASRLAGARKAGLQLAAQVLDGAGYQAALSRFNAALHDGHAGVVFLAPSSVQWRWPGFVAVWRGDGMYVYASVPGGPAAGSRVESCDGLPIARVVESNVFAFQGRADEPGNWWAEAADVFVDKGNPFIQLPRVCSFSLKGQPFSMTLAWSAYTDEMLRWRRLSYNGDVLPVGLSEPRSRLYWAAMPEFQPDQAQRAAYRVMSAELREHPERYQQADAMVIDLRGNHGGSSMWSLDFASALWGDEEVARRDAARTGAQQVWWRASTGNVKHVRWLVGMLKEQGNAQQAVSINAVADAMQQALEAGERFFVSGARKPDVASNAAAAATAARPAFTRPVYVIVPGQCVSACLDALDYFTMFPNTKLVGAPSSADSTYMEVRYQPLDSGLARVVIPTKVYVGRPRSAGQFYTPHITVSDLDWSTTNFLTAIEADLKR
ncbi:MAG TPA: S41 family peptidase [Duganella sp.]|nr:S41 family peptidase [Duganella sp.]